MMTKIGFEFPIDSAGRWDGFNEPGMEHFSGNPLEHLGREIVQNALDARLDKTKPVRIIFELKKISTNEIPDLPEFKKVIESCNANAKEEGPKAQAFFEQAIELIRDKKIDVLRVSDFNTTGISGPCENGKPYFAFMKATGQSKKPSDDSTGSFGIGKFAPYTVSGLRTVFVTTAWLSPEDDVLRYYTQGKSVLMSHQSGKKTHSGTGYWGIREECMPVTDVKKIPEWLLRSDETTGTTLNILGFRQTKNWQEILAANIATNFFGAIFENALEIDIGEKYQITSKSISGIFTNPAILKAVEEQDGGREKFENVKQYIRALSNGTEVITDESEQQHLGRCEVRLIVAENMPKKVAILRNGMLITEELAKLKRFSDYKEFVAVVRCLSTSGNALLRSMEPPRHDDFEPARLPTEDEVRKGKAALDSLAKWIRQTLQQYATDPVSAVTNIDELADFFSDEDTEGTLKLNEENPAGSIKIRARKIEFKNRPSVTIPDDINDGSDDGDSDGSDGAGATEKNGDGSNSGDSNGGKVKGGNSGGEKKESPVGVPLKNVRAIVVGPKTRKILFTTEKSGVFQIQIQDSGADANRNLKVITASEGTVKDGGIFNVSASAAERKTIVIDLDEPFQGTLRVVANAV
jgi:hypothetical protein